MHRRKLLLTNAYDVYMCKEDRDGGTEAKRSSVDMPSRTGSTETRFCAHLSAGAITVIADIRPTALDTVLDYAHDTQIPVIIINNPANPTEVDDTRQAMQIYMEPGLTPTVVEMVNNIYMWERVYYIYDSLDAFPRIEQIHDTLHKMYFTPDVQPYSVTNASACIDLLMNIYKHNRGYDIRAILDIEPEKAQTVIDAVVGNISSHNV
ncbi:glutamate receptor 1 [Elysia marginata]|uniref:Glutamate receptor 1 n=1 Tax=Elysia marginata TaxID=1093978 RepID=A0AAV4HRG3_9GAST|nr:glutamate receptor 1 [Elysia marginata]